MRRSVVNVRHSLPGNARADAGSRPEHDAPVSTGRAFRTGRSEYRVHCALTGIDADGTHFALMGEGRDCFGGTAYSLIEEIYVLRDGQPVLVKRNSADF